MLIVTSGNSLHGQHGVGSSGSVGVRGVVFLFGDVSQNVCIIFEIFSNGVYRNKGMCACCTASN